MKTMLGAIFSLAFHHFVNVGTLHQQRPDWRGRANSEESLESAHLLSSILLEPRRSTKIPAQVTQARYTVCSRQKQQRDSTGASLRLVRLPLLCAALALFLLLASRAVEASVHPTPAAAAAACKPQALKAPTAQTQSDRFVGCWNDHMMSAPQKHVAQCARDHLPTKATANVGQFALCSQGLTVARQTADVLTCMGNVSGGIPAVASCSAAAKLSPEQTRAVDCVNKSQDMKSAATCVAVANLPPEQKRDIACLQKSPNDAKAVALCVGTARLSPDQQHAVSCVNQHQSDATAATICIATGRMSPEDQKLVGCVTGNRSNGYAAAVCVAGTRLSPEQQRIATCAAQYSSNPYAAALCAGGAKLTPEQLIVAQCAIETLMEPHAFAVCVTEQLTQAELQKCLSGKIGGDDGCFGKNNDLVKAVQAAFNGAKALAGGPNSLVNNPGQIWGGSNSFVHTPSQIWGGDHSVVHNPGQIWGGPNSLFNNPAQLAGGPNSVVNNPGQLTGGPNSVVNNPGQLTGGPNSIINNPGQVTGGHNSVINNPGQLFH